MLHEARRNPEKNPKIDILTELTKYSGDDDLFVSFTSGFNIVHRNESRIRSGPRSKIGMNPKSEYNTPLGIYCYPLDYVIRYSLDEGRLTAPFTGSQPWKFLYLLRRKNSGYVETNEDAEPFYEKLKTFVMEAFPDEAYAKRLISEAEYSANEDTTRGHLWNLARLVSQSIEFKEVYNFTRSAVAWNYIMRTIGCLQWVDRSHQGLIHSNEPTQSVFFSVNQFTVVDMFPASNRQVMTAEDYERIFDTIISGKFNLENFDPTWIKKLSLSNDNAVPVLEALDKGVKAIQRKVIGTILSEQLISSYYISDWKSTIAVINKFADISPATHTDVYMRLDELADIERVMGRKMTTKEWNSVIIHAHENGWFRLIKSIHNNEAEFVEQYIKRWIDLPRKEYEKSNIELLTKNPDWNPFTKFNIQFTDAELIRFFYKSPSFVLSEYSHIIDKLSPQDWIRAVRTSGLGGIVDAAPIRILKMIVSAIMKFRHFASSDFVIAVKRLLDAGEKDFALSILMNTSNIGTITDDVIVEFIIDNINEIIAKMKDYSSRNVFSFMIHNLTSEVVLTDRSKKKLWKELDGARATGADALYYLIARGVFTIEDLRSHVDSNALKLVYSNAMRGGNSPTQYKVLEQLDLDFLFYWHDRLQKSPFIPPRHMIAYFSRPEFPDYDRIWAWHPASVFMPEYTTELIDELFRKVPRIITNEYFCEYLSPEMLYKGVTSGELDFSKIKDGHASKVWSALLRHDINMFDKMYYDPRFRPLPKYILHGLSHIQRKEFFSRALPAELIIRALQSAEGYEFTVKPSEEQKLLTALLRDEMMTELITVAMGKITIHNFNESSLSAIQKHWINFVAEHNTLVGIPQILRRMISQTRSLTSASKAYAEQVIVATVSRDIRELQSLGLEKLVHQIQSQA